MEGHAFKFTSQLASIFCLVSDDALFGINTKHLTKQCLIERLIKAIESLHGFRNEQSILLQWIQQSNCHIYDIISYQTNHMIVPKLLVHLTAYVEEANNIPINFDSMYGVSNVDADTDINRGIGIDGSRFLIVKPPELENVNRCSFDSVSVDSDVMRTEEGKHISVQQKSHTPISQSEETTQENNENHRLRALLINAAFNSAPPPPMTTSSAIPTAAIVTVTDTDTDMEGTPTATEKAPRSKDVDGSTPLVTFFTSLEKCAFPQLVDIAVSKSYDHWLGLRPSKDIAATEKDKRSNVLSPSVCGKDNVSVTMRNQDFSKANIYFCSTHDVKSYKDDNKQRSVTLEDFKVPTKMPKPFRRRSISSHDLLL